MPYIFDGLDELFLNVFWKPFNLSNRVLLLSPLNGGSEKKEKDLLVLGNRADMAGRRDVDRVRWADDDELTEVILEVGLELVENPGKELDSGLCLRLDLTRVLCGSRGGGGNGGRARVLLIKDCGEVEGGLLVLGSHPTALKKGYRM